MHVYSIRGKCLEHQVTPDRYCNTERHFTSQCPTAWDHNSLWAFFPLKGMAGILQNWIDSKPPHCVEMRNAMLLARTKLSKLWRSNTLMATSI
eukprot:1142216-Pelagomonas_calceolata.AAC.8